MKKMNLDNIMMASMIIMMILLIIICVISILWAFNSSINYNKNNYDVNSDGEINSKDMLDLRKYLIEKGE